jgi:hypothetical protein
MSERRYICDVFEKEEEERERERERERGKGKGGFMSFLSRAESSRDDMYARARCLSVSVSSRVMAAKGDFRFFFFSIFSHMITKIHRGFLLNKN